MKLQNMFELLSEGMAGMAQVKAFGERSEVVVLPRPRELAEMLDLKGKGCEAELERSIQEIERQFKAKLTVLMSALAGNPLVKLDRHPVTLRLREDGETDITIRLRVKGAVNA